MHLHFVSREAYRQKDTPDFLNQLIQQFGPCYVLPEGGTNELAIRGTAEILPEISAQLGLCTRLYLLPRRHRRYVDGTGTISTGEDERSWGLWS